MSATSTKMSSRHAYCHVRHLSTRAAAATETVDFSGIFQKIQSTISISRTKSKLKYEYHPDKALEIYSSVSPHYTSPLSSRYTQEFTVRRLSKCHRFSDIETLLESHKNDPKINQEPFLSSLIRSYGIAGMFDHALKTYGHMDDLGTPRSDVSFNISSLLAFPPRISAESPSCSTKCLKVMVFLPNKYSYGNLIKAYCEMGSPESAMERLKEMEGKGIDITAVVFSTIMHAFYKKGKNEEAENLWNEMVKRGCALDVGAYNVRIMHFSAQDAESVKGSIEEMKSAGLKPDTITYNYLMTGYCLKGMMDEAFKVYEDLEGNACKPNAATFRTLIFHLCKNERFEIGYKVFKEGVKLHKIPDFNTLKHLVEGLVKRSKIKEAND